MKIAILNESFFKESHLNALRALGDLTIHENTDTVARLFLLTQDKFTKD
jgi:hypothetical protein